MMDQFSDSLFQGDFCAIHMAAFENHPNAVFVLDSDGYYQHCNQQVYSLLGYAEETYRRRRFGELMSVQSGKLVWQAFQKALNGETQDFVVTGQHRSGHEVHLQNILVPVSINGQVWVMGYSRDITQEVLTERKLRESQRQLEKAQENAKLGNWSLDFETRMLELTESARVIFDVTHLRLPSSQVAERIPPDDYAMVLDLTLRSINEPGWIGDCEYRVVHQDGTLTYVHAHWTVTTDNISKRPVMIGTVQDITERKRTEELLINTEKLAVVGHLAAGMAHEIRNPLTVVQGFIQLLESTPVEIKKQSSYFELVKESLKQIDFLAEQMLVLAKPQAENRVTKNLVTIVQNVIDLFRAESLLHNVEIKYWYEAAKIPVICNEQRIKQVFINIMKNAFEAAANECEVTVNLLQDKDMVSVTFLDNGQGIDPERIKSIGEPFYTTKEKGTGLGLMVSRKIVRDHAGDLVLRSEVGTGTTVTVTFPVATLHPDVGTSQALQNPF